MKRGSDHDPESRKTNLTDSGPSRDDGGDTAEPIRIVETSRPNGSDKQPTDKPEISTGIFIGLRLSGEPIDGPGSSDSKLTETERELVARAYGLIRREIRRAEFRGIRTDDESESDAVLASIAAARRYRPELGWKWSSYVTPWIRRAIVRGAASGSRFLGGKPAHRLDPIQYRRASGATWDDSPEAREARANAAHALRAAISGLDGILRTIGEMMIQGKGRRSIGKELGLTPAVARALCDQARFAIKAAFGLVAPEPTPQGELFPAMPQAPKRRRK